MKKMVSNILTIVFVMTIVLVAYGQTVKGEDIILASVDYVDMKIEDLQRQISSLSSGGTSNTGSTTTTSTTTDDGTLQRVDNVEKSVGAIETNLDSISTKMGFLDQVTMELSDGTTWQIIEVQAGVSIYATNTSEVILRSGTATAIGNQYDEGLSDVTNGSDIKNGQAIGKNHYLIIPRGDGRGIKAETTCYIMYKGLWYMQ